MTLKKMAVVYGFILLGLGAIAWQNAFADVVDDLYESELPVRGQSLQERNDVARQALAEVLVRVSGKATASQLALDESLVPRATRYVQQLRYRSLRSDEYVSSSERGRSPYNQKLWLRFDENSVNKMLREQQYPVWGKTRPATLVWLAVEEKSRREIIDNQDQHFVRKLLLSEAGRKGLPLRLPLMDLADQSKLSVGEVWGNFEDRIMSASERYQTPAVLVGRLSLGYGDKWRARWSLYLNNRQQDWETEDTNVSAVLAHAMAMTAESLAMSYAQVSSVESNGDIMLEVADVRSLTAYTRVVNYLEGLSMIKKVQPHEVKSDRIIFRLTSHSDRQGLARAISLGHMLVENPPQQANSPRVPAANADDAIVTPDLYFKLVP